MSFGFIQTNNFRTNASNSGLHILRAHTNNFHFLIFGDDSPFRLACTNGTAACDREGVFDRKQERLLEVTCMIRTLVIT